MLLQFHAQYYVVYNFHSCTLHWTEPIWLLHILALQHTWPLLHHFSALLNFCTTVLSIQFHFTTGTTTTAWVLVYHFSAFLNYFTLHFIALLHSSQLGLHHCAAWALLYHFSAFHSMMFIALLHDSTSLLGLAPLCCTLELGLEGPGWINLLL